jgi:hypothetical protein
MKGEVYYIKSLEEDFHTKRLVKNKKKNFQSIQDMIKRKKINPNTISFGKGKRLSTTILDKRYLKTYRPQGIIFQTSQKPDYIFPFDLTILAATKNIIVHYYRIKNDLHIYYNRTLIPGFEKFIFKDLKSLIKKFPSPKKTWISVNSFRKKSGLGELPKQKFRLVEYNEAVFHKPVKIRPIAIFGYRKKTAKIAEELNLPHFVSAKHFYNSLNK